MKFYELHPQNPQKRFISKAVEVLKNGGIIIYPTDTLYGFGCDIMNKKALDRIYKIKGENENKLLSFVCPDLKDIAKYARVSDYAYKAMKKHLPGPYTFVLPASRLVPKLLWTKRKTVGIRVPDNEITITLAKELGNPILSTSVSNKNVDFFYDSEQIEEIFGNQVDLMLSVGILEGKPSSIIDLSEDDPIIIREGIGDISYFL